MTTTDIEKMLQSIISLEAGLVIGASLAKTSNEHDVSSFRQVDWNKVYKIIEFDKARIMEVFVGLEEDWLWTADSVYSVVEGYKSITEVEVYAASNWATPSMRITYTDREEVSMEVWKWGSNPDSYFEHMGGKP